MLCWVVNGYCSGSVLCHFGGMAPKRCHAEPKHYRVRYVKIYGTWWTVDGCFWMAGAIGRSSVGKRARIYIVKRGKLRAHCAMRGKAAPHVGIAVGSIQSDATMQIWVCVQVFLPGINNPVRVNLRVSRRRSGCWDPTNPKERPLKGQEPRERHSNWPKDRARGEDIECEYIQTENGNDVSWLARMGRGAGIIISDLYPYHTHTRTPHLHGSLVGSTPSARQPQSPEPAPASSSAHELSPAQKTQDPPPPTVLTPELNLGQSFNSGTAKSEALDLKLVKAALLVDATSEGGIVNLYLGVRERPLSY
ncbi:uncharacterized protein F5147DRAFT_652882 [Suillus discolor]|uniref:Uncharacterized protein n=1 Tax=Suillus discolor TaxID=1912936 RepID=A0A9P7JUJ2_9AGAM|nr:uncharacterized protein F5147DRAFT_652882 [Suillus discolor]KAG2108533.1 hypothetical protein F5147DRAFT_652882 [Suillus discolor]